MLNVLYFIAGIAAGYFIKDVVNTVERLIEMDIVLGDIKPDYDVTGIDETIGLN